MAGVIFVCSDDGWESDVLYLHGALTTRGCRAPRWQPATR